MALTKKQTEDLDNSMMAAQSPRLGDLMSFISGSLTNTATIYPTAVHTIVEVSGITSIGVATVTFSGSVLPTNDYDTVTRHPTSASAIIVHAWKESSSGSLAPATAPFTPVTWYASGI